MIQEINIQNGLEYKERMTKVTPVIVTSDAHILDHAPKADAWFIAYLDHRVIIGRIKDGQFAYYQPDGLTNDLKLESIQKLRIFNTNSELYIWRTALGGHKGRLREDGIGVERGTVDALQVLFGTEANKIPNTDYTKLTEKRGTEIILPLADLGINEKEIDDKKGRLCVQTRSYIGTIEETGQASYEDVRFIEFVKYQEEKK